MNQQAVQKLSPEQEDEVVDLASYLDTIIDSRRLIAIVALVVTLLGGAYAFISTPVYETNILVQVEDSANPSTDILGSFAGAFDLKSAATAEIEILRSRMIVTRAIKNARVDLTVQPKYFPIFGKWLARHNTELSQPGIFGLGGYVWGSEHLDVTVFNVPPNLEDENFTLTVTGADRYNISIPGENIEVSGKVGELVKKVTSRGTVEVQIADLNANPGAKFLITREKLLDTIEELQKTLTIAEKGKQSGVIGVSLQGDDPRLTAATLNELGQEYIRQNIDRKSAEAQKSLDFLEKQLPEMKAMLEQAESKYNALRNNRGTVDLTEEAKAVLERSVQSQTKLVELQQKRDELSMRYQDTHPLIQAVDQQIRTVTRELESVNEKIRAMPSIEQDVLRLTRDVKVSTDLYTSLLNSAQQLRLVKASKVGNARLLDSAVVPLHPVRPKRPTIIILSLIVGAILGIICAFVRRTMFGGVEEPHEIEQRLGLTVSAAVPYSDMQNALTKRLETKPKTVAILAQEDPNDSAIESMRSFRTSLQFSMLGAKNKIVMLTGPTPGLGKSFVSVNLAAVLASTGKRILLIDADMRKGYLQRYFGIQRENGLSEVIAGQLPVDKVIHREIIPSLDFISTGVIPPRPAELLENQNFANMLTNLELNYDLIVIDTPPVLPVTDPLIVAQYAGTIFNVVRAEVSTLGEIDETVKRLNQAGHTIAGVVLNGLKPRRGTYGTKYGKYRYTQYKY